MSRTSWKGIADMLAERLMHQAHCRENHQPLDPKCPSCEDIAAYEAYLAAGGRMKESALKGRSVPIHEIMNWRGDQEDG